MGMQSAGAQFTCSPNCDDLLDEGQRSEISEVVANQPVVMYGWESCPCVQTARQRFMSKHLCFVENTWLDPSDPKMQYLQCLYGSEHHSFIWFNEENTDGSMAGGNFIGNGFALAPTAMSDEELDELIENSGAKQECQGLEEENLTGGELQSCSDSSDVSTTGFTRSGTCVWQPNDGGYHQVCVTMSNQFLDSSANIDKNDLSSVVSDGGHWCICAWAWASAVSRDPENYEGIHLECDRTNARLRQVYEMHISNDQELCSPGGACYKAQAALDAVNELCPEVESVKLEQTHSSGTMFLASPIYAFWAFAGFVVALVFGFIYFYRKNYCNKGRESISLDYTFERVYEEAKAA